MVMNAAPVLNILISCPTQRYASRMPVRSAKYFKVRDHAAIRTLFVTLEPFFEIHNVCQASEQNLTKSHAADRNFARLGVWVINNRKCQKSLQVGVQKVDRLVRFCCRTTKVLEQSCGKTMLQCSRAI